MISYPQAVRIVEVGPRDGLQNEKEILSFETKVALINRLTDAGLQSIEAGAFVSPKWVPQMADTDRVMAHITRKNSVSYPVLVPNEKGMAAALDAGAREIAVFTAASEAFCQKNINCTIDESLARFANVIKEAHQHNIKVRGYVSCVLGCPYQGDIAPADVALVSARLFDMGCYEISLGDTIGVGTPLKAQKMLEAVFKKIPNNHLAVHFHDTYGQALANILISLQMGISVIDAAVGGLGGCPYAKGASGNVATEDVVYMLQGMGIETGVDLGTLSETALWLSTLLKREPQSKYSKIKALS